MKYLEKNYVTFDNSNNIKYKYIYGKINNNTNNLIKVFGYPIINNNIKNGNLK